MWKLYLQHLSYKFGIQIGAATTIGRGLHMGHFGTIVVHPDAIIGANCNIAQAVTIGIANRGSLAGVPTLGDRVWVGAGSVIVGRISIGSNVLVAPNSVVRHDVPADSLVSGNPAQITHRADATEGYVNWLV